MHGSIARQQAGWRTSRGGGDHPRDTRCAHELLRMGKGESAHGKNSDRTGIQITVRKSEADVLGGEEGSISKRKKVEATKTFEELNKASPHMLASKEKTMKRTACNESNGVYRRSTAAIWWSMRCHADDAGNRANMREPAIRCLVLKGKLSHASRAICWSRHPAKYFCWQCGATAEKHLSSKIRK
eukprot:2807474-Pyramimonas_sp.AAC.1